MSDDDHRPDDERRVADAMAAFGAQVRPDAGGWDRIDARLDERRGAGGASGLGGARRPLLVAAAAAVLVVLVGAVVVRARATDGEVQVATAPGEVGELAIVAVDPDGRLVELAPDGSPKRVVYGTGVTVGAGAPLMGKIAVSESDRTIYAERPTAALCESADARQFGEVVAVSFDDGGASVVAPVGAFPVVSAGGDRLAYLTSEDGSTCSSSRATPVVGVIDLRTGARTAYRPSDLPPLEASRSDGPAGTDLPTAGPVGVLDLAWDADGSVLVMVADARSTAASVQRVAFGPELALLSVESIPNVGKIRPSGPAGGDQGLFADAIVPMGAGRVVVGGRVHHDVATQMDTSTNDGGSVEVFDVGLRSPADLPGSSIDLHISSEQLGVVPTLVGDLSVDETTGDLLVVVHGLPTVDTEAIESLGGSIATTRRLFRWDGGRLSDLGSAYRSAAWIRVTPDRIPPPSNDGSLVSTSTTVAVAPPGSDLPQITAPQPEPSAPGLGEERPEDAAAITDAFRSFFEQGDQSALEGSGVLEPALDEGAKTVPNGGKGATVTIDAIIFRSDTEAEVRFRLDQDGNYFTAATAGSAVVVDGRWKVSAATMCTLLSRVNIACPTAP